MAALAMSCGAFSLGSVPRCTFHISPEKTYLDGFQACFQKLSVGFAEIFTGTGIFQPTIDPLDEVAPVVTSLEYHLSARHRADLY